MGQSLQISLTQTESLKPVLVNNTHHPAVYFRGAPDFREDLHGDIKVPKKYSGSGE